jgi:2'-5' RNA ligase
MTRERDRTAVVVPVPEAEHALRPWRSTYTRDGRDGMWAHVTLLHPFLEPGEVAAELPALREHFAAERPFGFVLSDVRRFPGGVVYLAPEPDEPFRALIAGLAARYPDRPPYGGAFTDVVPHCTVVHVDEPAVLGSAEAAIRRHLPLRALALEAWLVELVVEGWSVRERLPFGAG